MLQFQPGSPQHSYGIKLLRTGTLVQHDGAQKLLEALRLQLGTDTQQDASEHYRRFLHQSSWQYHQSMHHYLADES